MVVTFLGEKHTCMWQHKMVYFPIMDGGAACTTNTILYIPVHFYKDQKHKYTSLHLINMGNQIFTEMAMLVRQLIKLNNDKYSHLA